MDDAVFEDVLGGGGVSVVRLVAELAVGKPMRWFREGHRSVTSRTEFRRPELTHDVNLGSGMACDAAVDLVQGRRDVTKKKQSMTIKIKFLPHLPSE